ncbi:MAG: primosomal protein N' [Gammaproteobacteria bacterium]|nr:primosomal protein N' [Gammaproteobacteria bacterium]|tara:strand:- start:451 stop:2529 length:2079 start_codon:yes stop_codon:yes gene_type:complete
MTATPASAAEPVTILRVAVPSPLRRSFDYALPIDSSTTPDILQPGIRLRVPFGNRELTGILLEVSDTTQVSADKLKPAIEILDQTSLIPGHLLKLWLWAARYYQHPVGDALHTLMPTGLRGKAQAGIKKRKSDTLLTGTTELDHPARDDELTDEQQRARDAICAAHGAFQCFLLDGVTGSGKTEIYLQVISDTLARERQVLVLVPEISLTPQTVARFRQRFPQKSVAIMHSGLTPRQRLNAWLAAAQGEADIIIGTRSAIFTPLARPGLIVIDEEHDSSFKQQDGFRYSARDLGVIRAQSETIPIVLGSATPSLESLHNALSGRYRHLRLTRRPGNARLPVTRLIDTSSQTLEDGFSTDLIRAIRQHVGKGNQALVFINRRGFAPVLQCRDCGWTAECRHCDARMTLHRTPVHLRCHHCERREPVHTHCPECQGKAMLAVGMGTERSEALLQRHFPETRVIRVDRDATSRKHELDDLLAEINQGTPCILVGTQMLAKGHHFPAVTLVAVLDADSGLFSADFRGQEFMAQLLVQVSGRAGRADNTDRSGEVLIQTRHSTHQSLQMLINQGYHALATQLLDERRQAGMPPFAALAILRAEAINAGAPAQFLSAARAQAEDLLGQMPNGHQVQISGPLPAPMEKRANRYRQQLLLRSPQRADLQTLLPVLCLQLEQMNTKRNVRWSVDVDPQDMI